MNEYDLLLHWFSTHPCGEASAVLVGDACAALGQRVNERQGSNRQSYWRYHFLDPLYRLGHVEPVGRNKWAVLPPTVLWIGGKRREGEVHVYGARSRMLQEQLQKTWGQQFIVVPQDNGPALWKWVGTRIDAAELARSIHSELHDERGDVLLAALPRLADAVQHLREWRLPPTRERWEFFQVTSSPNGSVSWHWRPLSGSHSLHPGVYRTVKQYPTTWVHVSASSDGHSRQARLLEPQNPDHIWIAQWLELARKCRLCLRYETMTRTLKVPDLRVHLPVLVDRALRLASGLCPTLVTHDSQWYLVFANIGRRRACQAARVLDLPLETAHG
jgi:hypothetical protein